MKMEPKNIRIDNYTYHLPEERVAEFPLTRRDSSKFLKYRNGQIEDGNFTDVPDLIPENALLVLNNARVIEARLLFQKTTGGLIEIFCLEPHQHSIEQSLQSRTSVQWKCMIGGASKWKPGQLLNKEIELTEKAILLTAKYITKEEDSFIIEFTWNNEPQFAEVLHAAGAIPLPPYIKRTAEQIDSERYQTVFSKEEGSVAAPTAALHFTDELLNKIRAKATVDFVTLHVGAGTFKPVKTETIGEHQMHGEPFTVTKRLIQNLIQTEHVIAVGTTSLRTLESLHWLGVKLISGELNEWGLHQWEAYELMKQKISTKESLSALLNWMNDKEINELHCRTSLIIVPSYPIQIPKALITNFHQPQSTLLLLVAAFIGEDWRKVYQHALDNNYRFLSYGDSSFLQRQA
jgi:S-adenosylmethionine:tRNA ribosyltransferase-isomerase